MRRWTDRTCDRSHRAGYRRGSRLGAWLVLPALTLAGGCSRAVDNIDEVKAATVRILAEGPMAEAGENGEIKIGTGGGSGSGFLVSGDGLILTNYHVAMNAPNLKVFLNGDPTPRSASLVGASQCNDVALLKIEGRDLPFFELDVRQPIKEGDSLFLAGFPRGTETYTLKPGAVSTLKSTVNLPSAVLTEAFEHSADSQPGNSGGPVVRPNGKVVGIHFAGARDYKQPLAISSRLVANLLPSLRQGKDDSLGIGIDGSYRGAITGLLVASVKAGSPANLSGVEPGDLITSLQNVAVKSQNSVPQFCETIASRGQDQPLMVELYRRADRQILAGPLGKADPLRTKTSFTPFSFAGYDMLVPTNWSRSDQETVGEGDRAYVRRVAAPDPGAFNKSYLANGVEIRISRHAQKINGRDIADLNTHCQGEGKEATIRNGSITTYVWDGCRNKASIMLAIASSSRDPAYALGLLTQLESNMDITERQVMVDSINLP